MGSAEHADFKTYGCAVDRVGKLRIVHVFDEVSVRTVDRLARLVDLIASETSGNIVLSLLESCDVEAQAVDLFLNRTKHLHRRVTLVAQPKLTARYDGGLCGEERLRTASCFGDVVSWG